MNVFQLLHHGSQILNGVLGSGHVVLKLVVGGQSVEKRVGARGDLIVDGLLHNVQIMTQLLLQQLGRLFADA